MDFMMGRIGSQSGAKILMPSENWNLISIQTNSDTACVLSFGTTLMTASSKLFWICESRVGLVNQSFSNRERTNDSKSV